MINKKILVIGGDGYIGSRLVQVLSNIYYVKSLDCGWFGYTNTNIRKDYNRLTKAELEKYNVIILLAGHSSVKSCNGDIRSPWLNNVNNFNNLISKLSLNQLLIYASSASVYGNSASWHSYKESNNEFIPVNNYDITKYVLDLHAKLALEQTNNIIGLRFGTVNGWAPKLRTDVMINAMVKHAKIHNEVLLSNKHTYRAILGIEDLCKAIVSCIETPAPGIYNLASFNSSIEEIATSVAEKLHVEIKDCGNTANIYNFKLDTKLFEQTFNFDFKETIDTITNSLTYKFLEAELSDRNDYIMYSEKN